MCDPVTGMFLLSTAMSAYGNMQEGQAAEVAGAKQQALNEIDANAEIASSQNKARQTARAIRSTQGAARAAYAASGVMVDTGTAQDVVSDIGARGAEDIYQTMMDGQNRARRLRQGGVAAAEEGRQKATAGMIAGGATLLDGYGKVSSGWKGGAA